MIIGGFEKFSLSDYPGKTSAVIFTRGCNFRCGFCHNPELIEFALSEVEGGNFTKEIPTAEIFEFLESRKGKLDAVTITGGEPTIYADLPEFLKKIKEMGFLVKLDTNGTNPEMLQKILNGKTIDFVAMDIKAPVDAESYERVTGVKFDEKGIEKIKKSISLIINSGLPTQAGLPHEFRTTIVKSLLSLDDIRQTASQIKGAQNYFLQKFVSSGKLLDPSFSSAISYSDSELLALASEISPAFVQNCSVR